MPDDECVENHGARRIAGGGVKEGKLKNGVVLLSLSS